MHLSERDRRVAAIGMVTIAALLAMRLVPVGWRWMEERLSVAREVSSRASEMARGVGNLPRARIELARARVQLAGYDSAAVEGEGSASAGATLTELVATAATAADAQLTSLQLVPMRETREALGHVMAHVTATGDLEAVSIFVEGLEAGPELLAIRGISLTQADPNLAASRHQVIRVELDVEGVYRRGPGADR